MDAVYDDWKHLNVTVLTTDGSRFDGKLIYDRDDYIGIDNAALPHNEPGRLWYIAKQHIVAISAPDIG
jgi:hypothetical protein